MSAVLEKSKKIYQKAIISETLLFIFLSIITITYDFDAGVFVSLGFICGFLPQCFFIFFVLFRRESQPIANKMTALYYGEAFKIAISIVLFIAVFTAYKKIDLVFFIGYFLAILLNNIVPIYLKVKAEKS